MNKEAAGLADGLAADALEVCHLVVDTATIETPADLLAKAQAVIAKVDLTDDIEI